MAAAVVTVVTDVAMHKKNSWYLKIQRVLSSKVG